MQLSFYRFRRKYGRYFFLLPALAFVSITTFYPFIFNVYMSLQHKYLAFPGEDRFVGLENFVWLIEHEEILAEPYLNTAIFAAATILCTFLVGLALALALNRIRFRTTFRTALMLPWVISPVVGALIWRWLLDYNLGIINWGLVQLGFLKEPWPFLAYKNTAFGALISGNTWHFFPFVMIMFLAGLQGVPEELYDAAKIDGAGKLQEFWFVTVPQLRNIFIVVVLLGSIWTFNNFTLVYLMTGGAPAFKTMVLPVIIHYLAFQEFNFGRASAASVIMFVSLLIPTLIFLKITFGKEMK